ncbi:MAG: hypothetical protein ACRC1D_01105, partial [Culicoidibacterales bacterium]
MLLMMRCNVTFYAHAMNYYGPCVVSVRVWKDLKAALIRGERNPSVLDEYFTISDEAFVLLMLLNYHDRWVAEFDVKA